MKTKNKNVVDLQWFLHY